MKKTTVTIFVKAIPHGDIPVENCYKKFIENMSRLDSPLGFKDVDTSYVPRFDTNPVAAMKIKYPNKSIKFAGGYSFRDAVRLNFNKSKYDDYIWMGFKLPDKKINYKMFLHSEILKVIKSFGAYRATVDLNEFYVAYCGGYVYTEDGENGFDENGNPVRNNDSYNALARNSDIDIDGRNNIFCLRAVQYWSRELCHVALGFGPEEVENRLAGEASKLDISESGIYLVLDDNPFMSFDDFVQMNVKFRKKLGLT